MNVILVKDIDRVGKAGETVTVKDGESQTVDFTFQAQ